MRKFHFYCHSLLSESKKKRVEENHFTEKIRLESIWKWNSIKVIRLRVTFSTLRMENAPTRWDRHFHSLKNTFSVVSVKKVCNWIECYDCIKEVMHILYRVHSTVFFFQINFVWIIDQFLRNDYDIPCKWDAYRQNRQKERDRETKCENVLQYVSSRA